MEKDGLLAGLDELFDYKNQAMNDMLTNEKIVRLLSNDCETLEKPEKLMYSQVFPYEFVPDTVEHGQTFICCEVDIRAVNSKTFLNSEMYIWVFTHKSLLRLPGGGLRIDSLCSEIVRTINGSRMYGLGQVNLYSAKRFSPITNYQGRCLTFDCNDINRLYGMTAGNGVPSNRKLGR